VKVEMKMESEIKRAADDDATPVIRFGVSGANEWTFGYGENEVRLLADGHIFIGGRLAKPEEILDGFAAWLEIARRDAGKP
jgi:hypothetical protein